MLALSLGCQRSKQPPPVTANDVTAAQAQAQKEVADARVEATKDIKSAVKLAGSQSNVAAAAKITGSYDIAMAKADGDHQVAQEKCLLLAPPAQPPCKDEADALYQSAVAAAKASRTSPQH
jgi:hypothetical protein